MENFTDENIDKVTEYLNKKMKFCRDHNIEITVSEHNHKTDVYAEDQSTPLVQFMNESITFKFG